MKMKEIAHKLMGSDSSKKIFEKNTKQSNIFISKMMLVFAVAVVANTVVSLMLNGDLIYSNDVKAIFIYDNYIKVLLTFDDSPITIPTTDEIEYMANSSDIQSSASPENNTLQRRVLFFATKARGIEPSCGTQPRTERVGRARPIPRHVTKRDIRTCSGVFFFVVR